jgi:DNA-binding GntR family transcriptional regulator
MTQEDVEKWVRMCSVHNAQIHAHRNGDAAAEIFLDALDAFYRDSPRPELCNVIIHRQTIHEDQLNRAARHGIVRSFFPIHNVFSGDRHRDLVLDPERAARINPARFALDRKMTIALHHHAPIAGIEMLPVASAAINRITTGGKVLGPAQRITAFEAPRGISVDAAYSVIEDHRKGTLLGKLDRRVVYTVYTRYTAPRHTTQMGSEMPPATLRQQAYTSLRERLLSGELRAGMQLSEPDLAKQLGMSRTPVREAIRQMENEGLLEYAPRFGAMVRIPDRDELGEMYAVREALESYAAAEAAARIAPPDLKKLEQTFGQMLQIADRFRESGESELPDLLLRDYLQADLDFHKIVIASAGNRYMAKILDDTRLLVRVFTATSWQYDQKKLNEANRFHERLLEAMQHRDGEAARSATVEAMRVARENAIKAWAQQHQEPRSS